MGAVISITGDWSQTISSLQKYQQLSVDDILNTIGSEGVALLKQATPVDSGRTEESWTYKVEKTSSGYEIGFYNSNKSSGVMVAALIQYGHATGTGGYVPGRDYINPQMDQIFKDLSAKLDERMKSL